MSDLQKEDRRSSQKSFEITIVHYDGKEFTMDKIEGNSLPEALSKFVLLIAQVQERIEHNKRMRLEDLDDIPF